MMTSEATVKPTLRNTLLSKHLPAFSHVRQTFLEQLVIPSGYPFFEWNDRIYAVKGRYDEDTGVLYVDLA